MLPAGITRRYKLLMMAYLAQPIQERLGDSRRSKKLFLCVKKRKQELFVFRTVFMTCYFEKLVIAVNRNLCGYCINNVGRTQSLHMFTKNTTSF